MYRSTQYVLLAGVLGLVLALAGCSGSSGPATTTVQQISDTQLQALMDGAAPLAVVDVRSEGEFEAGYIPGSINIPLSELSSRIDELDRNVPVVCVCASGYRSVEAAEMLAAAGFRNVMTLEGGIRNWTGDFEPDCPVCP